MAQIRITNYTFNASARTVVFNDYTSINIEGLLLITNEKSNIIIYNFSNPLSGGTVVGNVLTLTYNTGTMSNTDKLQIYYDDRYTTSASNESILLWRRVLDALESNASVDRLNRQRITLDAFQLDTSGNTVELTGAWIGNPFPSAASGFQAGAGYGQPISGTTLTGYTSSGYTILWNSSSGYTNQGTYFDSGFTQGPYFSSGITDLANQGTPYLTNMLAESWYQMQWEGPVDQRWRVVEDSHLSYQKNVRKKLTFS